MWVFIFPTSDEHFLTLCRNVVIALQTSLIQGMEFPSAAELSSLRLPAKTLSIGITTQSFTA